MTGLLLTLHILVSVLLVGGILLQPGSKGGGLGATFGGGANTAFGAQGAAPFLAKATYWLAAGFFLTSLVIEISIVKEKRSVLDKLDAAKPAASAPAPLLPAPAAPVSPAKK